MTTPITDADIDAWLVDLRSGCGPAGEPPLAEVFAEVVRRMRAAEQERDLRRLESLILEYGADAVRETARE